MVKNSIDPYPKTLEAAVLAKGAGAQLYAGGTDLMARRVHDIDLDRTAPLIFLGGIPELRGTQVLQGDIRIGAMTTMAEIEYSPVVPALLAQGCGHVGSPALRNIATIGGNVCTASPAGDSLPALYVLDADALLRSPRGTRRMSISNFITGPGMTAMGQDELLEALLVPTDVPCWFHYRKVSPRVANAIAKVSIAAAAKIEDGILTDIRVAFGAVGPTVIRCTPVEEELAGRAVLDLYARKEHCERLVYELVRPIDDLRSTADYRRVVAVNLLEEFLLSLSNA